jgi:hypothetical protein
VIPYSELKGAAPPPPGVDLAHREDHLCNTEFAEVFGMDRDSFAKLAAWKRAGMKKKAELF